MRRRGIAAAVACAGLIALAGPAVAAGQDVPSSTKGTKRCGVAANRVAEFRVYVIKGKKRITCRRARRLIETTRPPLEIPKGWEYFDWGTGGGDNPGPWNAIWRRKDKRVLVGSVLKGPIS
jgi:hypothetical protein